MNPVQVITIGRSQQCDIIINDEKASRIHCQIMRYDDGKYGIVDFNSTNGTFVNEFRINGEHILNPYDVVRIGNTSLPWRELLGQRGKSASNGQSTAAYSGGTMNQNGGVAYGVGTIAQGSDGTAYGNEADNTNDTVGILSLVLGIVSVLALLLIVILFFTGDFGKLGKLLGANIIQLFPIYLHGESFVSGQWILIIIALLTGLAADFITIFSKRSHSSTESWGLALSNIGVTVGFIFLMLAIFAEQLTEGMLRTNLF